MEDIKKVTESQKRATKKWEMENREHSNYLKNRSACKCFIRNKATIEDLKELEEMINERLSNVAVIKTTAEEVSNFIGMPNKEKLSNE